MEHVALYRKYRPNGWDEVIGQDHVVKTLQGSISAGRIVHAYLFSGSRGTGKTSVARIFARAIGAGANDTYEIDAASNTGVDDVRALNEGVSTLPFESTYKVYIVDEVHMLSRSAWNALLKTLEEPPAYVVFILATTEIEKVPATAVSRCQSFVFKKPNREILREMVTRVAKKEGFSLGDGAAELLSILADGSFRDAQGILQKVISGSKDKIISRDEVEVVTGAPKGELLHEFLLALAEKNSERGFDVLRRVEKGNLDIEVFATLLLEKLRTILIFRHAPRLEAEIKEEIGEDEWKFLKDFSGKKGESINSAALLEFLDAYESLSRSAIPLLPLELALIKHCDGGRHV